MISDNQDTLIGMRLAGIKGVLAKTKETVVQELYRAWEDEDVRILIVTEKILALAPEEILEFKVKRDDLLIVEIPDRHGSNSGDYITRYIRESIGLKI